MYGVLMGFALGAMAFTKTGQAIGNQIAETISVEARRIMSNAAKNKPDEQSAVTAGYHRDPG